MANVRMTVGEDQRVVHKDELRNEVSICKRKRVQVQVEAGMSMSKADIAVIRATCAELRVPFTLVPMGV